MAHPRPRLHRGTSLGGFTAARCRHHGRRYVQASGGGGRGTGPDRVIGFQLPACGCLVPVAGPVAEFGRSVTLEVRRADFWRSVHDCGSAGACRHRLHGAVPRLVEPGLASPARPGRGRVASQRPGDRWAERLAGRRRRLARIDRYRGRGPRGVVRLLLRARRNLTPPSGCRSRRQGGRTIRGRRPAGAFGEYRIAKCRIGGRASQHGAAAGPLHRPQVARLDDGPEGQIRRHRQVRRGDLQARRRHAHRLLPRARQPFRQGKPTEFKSVEGSDTLLVVFQRSKK